LLPGIEPASAEVTFTIQGGGFGHAVGMSQYGAYGMALDGYTWQQILRHYFTGASPAAADPALLAEPIWVGIVQDQSRLELKVVATGTEPAAPAAFTVGGTTLVAAQGETAVIEALGGGACRVTTPAGSAQGPCSIDGEWDGWTEQPTTAIQLGACVLPNWNAPGGTAWQPCRYARGTLHIRPDNDTPTVHLSLEIDIEDYVLGISESPYAWGTTGGQAALEAQAVAARSYALHRALVRGDPASRPWCWCQLYDTTVDQFYAGWGHGTQTWIDAVEATAGQVMVHSSESRNGVLIPIQTFYSSSSFGWTEDSENGFTAYVPYLRAVDDHWSTLPAVGNRYARWSREFTASRLASLLPGLSTVTGAEVTRCSQTGAALQITFTGAGGPLALSTRELRGLLGLPSMQIIDIGTPADGSPACSGFAVTPAERGGTVTLAGLTVDDDNLEDSAGNGDGLAQCGERVEVTTAITAGGASLQSVNAALSSSDPYVSIVWNTTSAFPDLTAGASGANLNDWDLAVSSQTPDGHTAHLTMRISAAGAGPWDLDVPLTVSCPPSALSVQAGVLAGPGDVDGDGAPDVAVAYAQSGGPARLQVRSGASGEIISTVRLAPAGYTPIAATTLPSFAGSAASEVAVLLTAPGRRARVAIVDPAAGQKVQAFALSRHFTYYDLAGLPPSDGSATSQVAVLIRKPNGAVRAVLRDAASGARRGGIGFGRTLAPAALARLSDTDGERLLAVLGNTDGGVLKVQVRRVADRTRVGTLVLDSGSQGTDLVVVSGPAGIQLLTALAVAPGGGSIKLITAHPVSGEILASGAIAGLTSAGDLEAVTGAGRGQTEAVALLGRGPDGRALAPIVDPVTARSIGLVNLPAGYTFQDLAALGDGQHLAVFGLSPAGEATVTIRTTAGGAEVTSFTVP
jgi:SpoIID/LytB domain protein